jgi:hypothetical protein
MNYWKFSSPANWFSTTLPENWAEYDDEEGTYAFFNTDKWSGNFRITPFRWEGNPNKAIEYISSELKENANAVAIKIGDWDAAFYSKKATDGTLIYFWTTGTQNYVFLCSFSVDMDMIGTDLHEQELAVVENILNNIELN